MAAAKAAKKAPAKKSAPKKAAAKPAKAAAKAAAAPAFEPVPAAAPAAPAFTPVASPVPAGGQPYPQTPVLETPMAAVVLIVNILVPGLGTLIAGILAHQKLIGRAVAQFLLAIVIVGYVWAIITGVQALINASWGNKNPAARSA